ncbi:MAG TPA: PaaX family transcriptional regulator C-terminal domain-containing protein [Anaerolineales bacterium]|nr:PaaX family transcriptional regulator C-terminal domain-containing protein [Anaerolineales bacterium]
MRRPSPRTQLVLFNLYGDYVLEAGGAAWTQGLLEVLGLLGVGSRAARTTLSRMKRRGWLEARRVGKRSLYRATERTRSLLVEGSSRLFGPRPRQWDGRWTVLTFSLPGERRLTRHRLRTRLSWIGYGSLQPGTLIAAYPRVDEARKLVSELDAASYLHIFTGAHLDGMEQERIVRSCWDLPSIDARYARFLDRYTPVLRRLRNSKDGGLSPKESFVHRFWATYDYSEFPRIDPLLPDELLPRRWRGHRAYELLTELRSRLEEPAWRYLQEAELFAESARADSASHRPEGSRAARLAGAGPRGDSA